MVGAVSRSTTRLGARIGHNQGPPLDAGRTWRAYCWKKARAELIPPAPIEVVRRRVARAGALGLSYAQYASVRLGTGRDVAGLLFTAAAIGWTRQRPLPEDRAAKLAAVEACERLLSAPGLRLRIAAAGETLTLSGIGFTGAGPLPRSGTPLPEAREALRAITAGRGLPGDAVVMVGTRPDEFHWAAAARYARFLPAEAYFPGA